MLQLVGVNESSAAIYTASQDKKQGEWGRLSRWAYASPVLEQIQRAGCAVLGDVVNDALVVELAL